MKALDKVKIKRTAKFGEVLNVNFVLATLLSSFDKHTFDELQFPSVSEITDVYIHLVYSLTHLLTKVEISGLTQIQFVGNRQLSSIVYATVKDRGTLLAMNAAGCRS